MAKRKSPLSLLVEDKSAYTAVEAPCPYFGTCGGCSLQDISYSDQLALKRQRVLRALAPLGPLLPDIPLIPMENPWRYRNKAELTFGFFQNQLVLGYHRAGSFWEVVDLEDCLLLPESAAQVLREVRVLAQGSGLPAYDPKTHQGFFRYLIIRNSHTTGDVMVCLVTTAGHDHVVEGLATELVSRLPFIQSVYWGINQRVADVAVPEKLILLRGTRYLKDQLGPFKLEIHPLSFLQPNSHQAHRMYEQLCRSIQSAHPRVVWDLYCGIGLVGFYLSRYANQVYGIDVEPHHLEMAKYNAALNGLNNISFQIGKTETLLLDRRFWLQEAKPDVVVVDPPRAGLHPQAISSLLAARPPLLIYLSCNAQSLVRDLQLLLNSFPRYKLSEMIAFDMFPQTPHIELLTVLNRV